MNVLQLTIAAIAIVLLLLIVLIIFLVRKRKLKKAKLEKGNKIPELAIQAEQIKPASKSIVDTSTKKEPLTEPSLSKEPLYSTEAKSTPVAESETKETVVLSPLDSNVNLPQDSMLKRHYLTHLRSMIEALHSPHPTDSALSRHYDSLIADELEKCISDKGAIEKLICSYEDYKKKLALQIQEQKTKVEPLLQTEASGAGSAIQQEKPKLPEDSMLRRHAIASLYAKVQSTMPPRPTDSVLRRHYDTIVKNAVNNLAGCEVV